MQPSMKTDRLVGLLCGLVATLALANTTLADDEWGGWDEVPDDLLEMTDEASMAELSERLDRLVQGSGPETAMTAMPEDVLDRWLDLLSTPRGEMGVVPLERVMQGRPDNPGRSPWDDIERGDGPPGPPANRPGGGPDGAPGQGSGSSGNNPGQGSGPPSDAGKPDDPGNPNN